MPVTISIILNGSQLDDGSLIQAERDDVSHDEASYAMVRR